MRLWAIGNVVPQATRTEGSRTTVIVVLWATNIVNLWTTNIVDPWTTGIGGYGTTHIWPIALYGSET